MILQKLKTAFRKLLRANVFTYLNITALAVTICGLFIIYTYVKAELATDKHLANGEKIYRIVRSVEKPNASYETPTLAAPYREIIHTEMSVPLSDITWIYQDDELISYKDQVFFEDNVLYTDQHFFQLLDYPLAIGNPLEVLDAPNSVVISKAIAKKYFGEQNPIGTILEVEGKGALEVKGVLKAPENKSHLKLDFLVNAASMGYTSRILKDREAHAMTFYLKIPAQKLSLTRSNLSTLGEKHLNLNEGFPKTTLSLQSLSEIYFGGAMITDIARHGNRSFLNILILVAIILSLVVTANFVNLCIARLTKRVRQIGVKRILGSSKQALWIDWALEVYVVILLATLLGALCSYALLPQLMAYFEIQNVSIAYLNTLLLIIGFPLILTVLIITIPAWLFSSVQPFQALSGKIGQLKTNLVQRSLLFFQFIVSFVLIVFTLVIFGQFNYMQSKEIGLNKDQVLTFNSNNRDSWKNKDFIKAEIQKLSEVKDVTMVYGGIPNSPTEATSFQVDQSSFQWNTAYMEPNLVSLLDLQLVDGQFFDEKINFEQQESVVLNESAAQALGWPQEDLIGKTITLNEDSLNKRILGVVKDYHYESFRNQIEPLVIQSSSGEETFVVKLAGRDYQSVITQIENIWNQFVPKYPFSYVFLDDSFQKMHLEDTRNGKILLPFTLLILIITAMGTLSLGALIQQAKTKEVSIRKVLGAPNLNIFYVLGKDFIQVLMVASIIALPVGWILTTNWLDNFSYRITLSPLLFIMGFLVLIAIILTLILAQSWRTITSNPTHYLSQK